MKLRNPLAKRQSQEVIRQFGDALLVRNSNGQHKLIGGTNADRTAAFEWVSLFAHEIVFRQGRLWGRDMSQLKKAFRRKVDYESACRLKFMVCEHAFDQ